MTRPPEAPLSGWLLLALVVPVAFVELMGPPLPIEDYCDGVQGVLSAKGVPWWSVGPCGPA